MDFQGCAGVFQILRAQNPKNPAWLGWTRLGAAWEGVPGVPGFKVSSQIFWDSITQRELEFARAAKRSFTSGMEFWDLLG